MKKLANILQERVDVQSAFEFHIKHNIPIAENIFRPHSENYYELFRYAKTRIDELETSSFEKMILESDIGESGFYNGEYVPLDHPLCEETQELNKPKRGGSKKFYVFVKNDKGNIIKVEFGDTTGLNAKINDPKARASFAARHKCSTKKDKTKPGYWACRLPYYAKELGLKGGGAFFW
jgi:hypothetical protein